MYQTNPENMKSFALAAVLCFLLPFHLSAGWIITGKIVDREGRTIMKRYFIEGNDVKVERYNLIYSVNLTTENIILVDPVKLVFVRTNLHAYTEKMRQIKAKRLDKLLVLVPEDQKASIGKQNQLQIEQDIDLNKMIVDSLEINQLPDTTKLLEYRAVKFSVEKTGLPMEDVFFTKEVDISSELDMKALLKFMYILEPEDKTIGYMAAKPYLETFKKGLVLRRFIYEDGYRSEWQVNLIEHKAIPFYEFVTPDKCKELTLDKWVETHSEPESNNDYDDYE